MIRAWLGFAPSSWLGISIAPSFHTRGSPPAEGDVQNQKDYHHQYQRSSVFRVSSYIDGKSWSSNNSSYGKFSLSERDVSFTKACWHLAEMCMEFIFVRKALKTGNDSLEAAAAMGLMGQKCIFQQSDPILYVASPLQLTGFGLSSSGSSAFLTSAQAVAWFVRTLLSFFTEVEPSF